MQKIMAFDLEIATAIPEGVEDWSALHPLGISCAGAWKSDEERPLIIAAQSGDCLNESQALQLLAHLDNAVADGYTIVTVNGASFDFRELAANVPSTYRRDCATLAMGHFDLYYQVFCIRGYGPGLDAMARGIGLTGKPDGMDGAAAPLLWAEGKSEEVITYLRNDLSMTLAVARYAEATGEIRWLSRNDKSMIVNIGRLDDVATCNRYRHPNTSWMDNPRKREDHIAWCNENE